MLFNSFSFGIFLLVVYLLYWLFFNKKIAVRNLFILSVSYFFYACWNWRLLSLIVGISAVDYLCGYLLGKRDVGDSKRKLYLTVALVLNLSVLGFFKYCNFFIESFVELFNLFGSADFTPLDIILPVGISFYTFQGLSYVIDIYNRKLEPTKDAVVFFAFMSFFPQLIAGPIERAKELLPQFLSEKKFDYDSTRRGLFLIAVGLFKKVVIADRLAVYVDSVYADVHAAEGLVALVAVLFFAFQLYLDFSAYSQIAIGTARIFGFKLTDNFNMPYLSTSFKAFWARWHITLTNWFRDYLYFTLGGNRKGKARTFINILIIFAVSGLWHGASWNFVIWGCLNGLFLAFFDKVLHLDPKSALMKVPSCLFVVSAWALSLIFFRASTFSDATVMFQNLGLGNSEGLYLHGLNELEFGFAMKLLAGLMAVEFLVNYGKEKLDEFFFNRFFPLRWTVYILLVLSTLYLGIYGGASDNAFIYFQF